jgi:hypothetical protein
MSESSISMHEPSADDSVAADHASSAPAPPPDVESDRSAADASDADVILEIIRRGLAPDADGPARALAGDVCRHLAQLVVPPAATATAAPARAPAGNMPPPIQTPATPSSPVATIVTSLRNLPPEQLLDLAIQRLRAALPADATVPAPTGIQFQLVPVPPIGGTR